MSKRARTTTVLSSSRWLAYAAAGAATVLGAAQLAEGAIHYSGQIRERINNPDGDDHATLALSRDASLYFRAYSYAAVPSYNFAVSGCWRTFRIRFGRIVRAIVRRRIFRWSNGSLRDISPMPPVRQRTF